MPNTQTRLRANISPPKLRAIETSPLTYDARELTDKHQLWLHLHLPQLPLEVLTRSDSSQRACVLVEGRGARVKIALANRRAASLGVRVGMPLGAAQVLGELTVLPRDERAEQLALERLCAWAYQFSPVVSAVAPDGILLELKASLSLFGGLDALLHRVRRDLRDLAYKANLAIAPTPIAAAVLARSEQQAVVLSKAELRQAVDDLPLELLRLEPQQLAILRSIGVRSIGDCLRLPRAGLGRRTTPQMANLFARLLGHAPDPRPRFELPKLFQSSLDIPWEVDNAQVLRVAGERLLHELCAYLGSCAAVTRCLRWSLQYMDDRATHFQLTLNSPSRKHSHFALLLREHLSRMQLDGPVKVLALYVDDISPEPDLHEGDLFKHKREGVEIDWSRFHDRLCARLGSEAVKGLRPLPDHRPEHAWRWSRVQPGNKKKPGEFNEQRTPLPERPLWLMRQPIRLGPRRDQLDLNGPLDLLAERERIETGWWDNQKVRRDYFIATNPSGARLWVYRDLSGDRNWYLHGIFE